MFLPVFRTYFTIVLYVNGGRLFSSLFIFSVSEGQNLNFSSVSLTRSKSLLTFCFEHKVQLRSLDCFDHFARDRLYTFHSTQKNQQGTLILNLQSHLDRKKKNKTKGKGALKFSSVFNHLKHRVAYFEANWAFTVDPFRLTFFLKRISFNSFTCIFSTGPSIMNLILFRKKSI